MSWAVVVYITTLCYPETVCPSDRLSLSPVAHSARFLALSECSADSGTFAHVDAIAYFLQMSDGK